MEIHKGSVHLGNPDEGQLYDISHVLKKAPVFILKKLMQQKACRQEKDTLWDESKRLFNPHQMYIDLSPKLYEVKKQLLDRMSADD